MKQKIEQWKQRTSINKMILLFFSVLFVLYLLPTFIQVAFDKDLRIDHFYLGLPGVVSGDEPHYLVTTTSLINDHDYYIDNNYDNAYFHAGCDVGFRYVNQSNRVWRHVQIVAPDQRMAFPLNFSNSFSNLSGNELDKEYEAAVEDLEQKYNITTTHQVSNRPIGLPFFSALFLWPFKNICFIEHGAIYISLFISFIGLIFFFRICLFYLKQYRKKSSEKNVETEKIHEKENVWLGLCFTAILGLCTQYWFYSKTYFTEPYLATFLLVAYYLFFIKKQSFLPGLVLAIGFSMKYPFGMYLAIFGIFLLYKKEWKRIIFFVFGASGPIALVFYYSWLLSGHIFNSAQSGHLFFGNYLQGIIVWIFDPMFGVLPFAPFLILSILGLLWLWKQDRETAIILIFMMVPYFLFWSSYTLTQHGPGGYSARYIIPILGFLVLLVLLWYQQNKNKILFWIFLTLTGISFVINLQAAFLYPLFWNNPPWILFDILKYKWVRVLEVLKGF